MQRIRITVPATITNIGPGLGALGLAVQLNTSVTFRRRGDSDLIVESSGVDDKTFSSLEHPAVLAAIRVFQHMEQAPSGFQVQVTNNIPVDVGLGVRTAFSVAGVLGANNLLDANLPRDVLMTLAAQAANDGAGIAAAMLGGLATGVLTEKRLIYHALAPAQMRVVVAVPEIRRYGNKTRRALPKMVNYDDTLHNISRVPMLLTAFQQSDYETIGELMDDQLLTPKLTDNIDGYADVVQAATQAGAWATTLSGTGPAIVAFAMREHHAIADAMRVAFTSAGVTAQTWVLPVDRQGVVVSMTQTAR